MVNVKSLLWIAIFILLILILVCSLVHVPEIQNDLTTKSIKELNINGISFEGISFDGQDAILTGEVGSERLKASIEKIVFSLNGVRTVHNNLKVTKSGLTRVASLRVKEFNGKLFFTGTLPDSNTIQLFSNKCKKISWAGDIETAFDVDTALTDKQNLNAIFNWLIDALPKISNSNIIYENGILDIKGNVENSENLEKINSDMNKRFLNLSFTNHLNILSEESRQAQGKLQEMFAKQKIVFMVNSSELTGQSRIILDQIIKLLNANPSVHLQIEGHTDSSGDSDKNIELSQLRANSVQKYLIEGGISPERLSAKGYGDKNPVTSNATFEGRSINRRVEFVIKENN